MGDDGLGASGLGRGALCAGEGAREGTLSDVKVVKRHGSVYNATSSCLNATPQYRYKC